MMNLREKAREIQAAGEAERGNFEPSGAPKRVYDYWLRYAPGKKADEIRYGDRRENFCHFWRVVAIWAPLLWLWRSLEKLSEHPAFIPVVVAVVAAGIVLGSVSFAEFRMIVFYALAFATGFALSVYGIAGGWAMALNSDEERLERGLLTRKTALPSVAVLPVFLLAFGFVKLKRAWRSEWTDRLVIGLFVFGGLLGLALVGLLAVTQGVLAVLIAFGLVVTILGVMILALALLVRLSDFISGRRALARRRAEERAETEEPQEPRQPGRLSKFFSGLGDFVIFVSQVVRVKKWKICPVVEVNTNPTDI